MSYGFSLIVSNGVVEKAEHNLTGSEEKENQTGRDSLRVTTNWTRLLSALVE